jgi:spermidine synthase
MGKSRAGYQILFLVGACVLGYEILLTRAASAFFQYHFAFLVLSLAMFSLFASGVLYQRLRPVSERGVRVASVSLFGFLLLSPALFFATMPVLLLQGALLIFGFTVLFWGSFLTLHYLQLDGDAGPAYAANLFGSALGAALATISLILEGPTLGLIVLGVLAALAVFIQSRRVAHLIGMAVLLAVSAGLSAYRPGQPGVLWQRWNSFSYVKVVNDRGPVIWGSHGGLPPSLDLLIDSSADTAILPGLNAETRESIAREIANDITHVGYLLAPTPLDVAIVGSGGGRDVVGAQHFHPHSILAVEINPSVIEAVRRFSPGTYSGVDLVVAEGRSTLERSRGRYSIIQFGLVDTWAAVSSGAFALSESYLYTREAFIGYLRKLQPDGILSVTRWGSESDRLLSVAAAALEGTGRAPVADHVLIFEKDAGSPYSLITVLLTKASWTAAQREHARQLAARSGFQIRSYTPPSSQPALDDSPFFFYSAEGGRVIGESIVALAVASLVLLVLAKPSQFDWHLRSLAFFGAIGLGYMFVENVFLQKFILLIRNPTLSVSTVFLSFLSFSGVGSLCSKRIRFPLLALLIPLLLLFAVSSGRLITAALTWTTPLKVLLAVACIAPCAFLMGLFFPIGFGRIQASREGSEGMAWAMNGLFSVIAPPFALLLAVSSGFGSVLVAAAALYSIAYWVGRQL